MPNCLGVGILMTLLLNPVVGHDGWKDGYGYDHRRGDLVSELVVILRSEKNNTFRSYQPVAVSPKMYFIATPNPQYVHAAHLVKRSVITAECWTLYGIVGHNFSFKADILRRFLICQSGQ